MCEPCRGGWCSLNLLRMELTIRAAAPEELCWRGISACWVSPVAMSYTIGTMMLMSSWGTGSLWVSWSCRRATLQVNTC